MVLGKRVSAGSLMSFAPLVTVLAFGSVAASAADLGGSCCADLEERVAELEATTARKGNRKVSLTVSGWVNEAVFFWDDGVEQNAYVGTNELEQGRFCLQGDAKISSDWSAGYILEFGVNGAGSKTFNQETDGSQAVTARKSAWFVKSKTLGKVSIGRFDTATFHLLDNVDTTLTRNVSDFEAAGKAIGAFVIRRNGVLDAGGLKWTDFMSGFDQATAGQSGIRNTVRYDTPELAGFVMSASWGEDDEWSTALKYKGEAGDFALVGAVGYGESTDDKTNGGLCKKGTGDCQWWGAGALVMHKPTGLYAYGGVGENQIELKPGQVADDTSVTLYGQLGIERKWLELGKTNIFGEYREDQSGLTKGADRADINVWAGGIAQNVEAADITFYALYRHFDGESTQAGVTTDLDGFDLVVTGAKINF